MLSEDVTEKYSLLELGFKYVRYCKRSSALKSLKCFYLPVMLWNIINFQFFTQKKRETNFEKYNLQKEKKYAASLPSLPKESPKPRFIPISPRPKSLSMLLVIAPRYSSEKIMQHINPFSSVSLHSNPFRNML